MYYLQYAEVSKREKIVRKMCRDAELFVSLSDSGERVWFVYVGSGYYAAQSSEEQVAETASEPRPSTIKRPGLVKKNR